MIARRPPLAWPLPFRVLIPLLLAIASWTAARAAEAPAGTADWPQFLGPSRNGTYAGAVRGEFPAGGPPVLWEKDVGQGFSGPIVAGGNVFLHHRVGDRAVLDCFGAATGKLLWSAGNATSYADRFGFDEGPRATPAAHGDRVYTYGADGRLDAWNAADGTNVWGVDVARTFKANQGFFGIAPSPLVEGDAVILIAGGGEGAGVVAFDRASGKLLWKATDDAAGYASPVAATLGGRRRVLAFNRAGLVALAPEDGRVAFRFPWRSPIDASVNAATPLVVGDSIFLSASYQTGAALLDYAEPEPRKVWSSDEALSNHYATSVHHGGFLYGFHGRQEQTPSLRCVELRTGKVRWSEEEFGAGTISVAQDQLVILSEKGQLIVAPVTADGFRPTGRAQVLGFDTRAHPALAGGLMFARGKDKLICVDLRTPPAK